MARPPGRTMLVLRGTRHHRKPEAPRPRLTPLRLASTRRRVRRRRSETSIDHQQRCGRGRGARLRRAIDTTRHASPAIVRSRWDALPTECDSCGSEHYRVVHERARGRRTSVSPWPTVDRTADEHRRNAAMRRVTHRVPGRPHSEAPRDNGSSRTVCRAAICGTGLDVSDPRGRFRGSVEAL